MICPSCADGADLAALAQAPIDRDLADRMADYHAGCPGGTWCACQHRPAAPLALVAPAPDGVVEAAA